MKPLPKDVHEVVVGGRTAFYLRPPQNPDGFTKPIRILGTPGSRQFDDSVAAARGLDPRLAIADEFLRDYFTQRIYFARTRAKAKKLECSLSLLDCLDMYDRQGGRCDVSGLAFSFEGTGQLFSRAFAPSIDRRDNALGYIRQNVRLVCRITNFAMGTWGETALLKLARAMVKNQEDQ